jgi:enterochelin esterase-like enzyme
MKIGWITLVIALLPVGVSAQTGKVFDSLTVTSAILKMDRQYAVYLPPDYDSSQRSYPVLYLLHGTGDGHRGWIQFGEVARIADEAIRSGAATPMVIVMPDADTGQRGYVNDPKSEWRYEDFFFEEFIPAIEKTYRIRAEKNFRAVAGLSMGGGGSFVYALHHPEFFAAACPLSADVGPLTPEETKAYLANVGYEGVYTEEQVAAFYRQRSVMALIAALPEKQKKAVRWYIECGDDDFLYEGNSLVHIALRKAEVPHEYRVNDGGHSWGYWRRALPTVLAFVSESFHKK